MTKEHPNYYNYFVTKSGKVWSKLKERWLIPQRRGKYLKITLYKNKTTRS